MFRQAGQSLQVFLVHPGGPYWSRRNEGAWTIPKGESEKGEDLLYAARREFTEETGFHPLALS
jgi:predicted NUDIX family NTP pyrophosphohydrolase